MKIATRKRRVAVSPVIATLLLIAIAVAAAIIVYAFVTGLIGGLTTGSGSSLVTITGGISVPSGSGAGTLVLSLKNGASNPITAITLQSLYNSNTNYYCLASTTPNPPCPVAGVDLTLNFANSAGTIAAGNTLAVGSTASLSGTYSPKSGSFSSGSTYTALILITFSSGSTQTNSYAITAEL